MSEKITEGKHVELAYSINIVDGEDVIGVYEFSAENPDAFVFGHDPGMLEAFAEGLRGKMAGDSFDFTLTPDKAFGKHDDDLVHVLDKSIFKSPEGEFDSENVAPGHFVTMMTSEGYPVDGLVLEVTDSKVTVDFNHQLAGQTVRYTGSVIAVRDATPEELEHHHCGCGHCHHDGEDHDCGCGHNDGCDCNK